ncbi:MAG: glucosidase [Armatimonadota bacterium]|nr:glucosidase [Armatimonadota bacterium]
MARSTILTAEEQRLAEDAQRVQNWKRWGPYLAERQWGTVREDYSADGSCWTYLPHDDARSRAYRWGEDGLLGITDRKCRLCFALALWNGRDPILKERLFGLANPEGNHGEDVKECYFYLDSTPTHSYLKALYKYPQNEFPYAQLVEENRRRGKQEREFELTDTSIFDENRYFDVFAEYAKAAPDDILIRITLANRGPEAATLHLLPTLWFRNDWSWGRSGEWYGHDGRITLAPEGGLIATHNTLGCFRLEAEPLPGSEETEFLFTENETNMARFYGGQNTSPYVKDAFHEYVVHDRTEAVNPDNEGTKAAAYYRCEVPAGASLTVRLRLYASPDATQFLGERAFGPEFEDAFAARIREADEFYERRMPLGLEEECRIIRQAYAGLLWSKQFYFYVINEWLAGDPAFPSPPAGHQHIRNEDWHHVFCSEIISMPDKWEYPWFAAWDLAFHMIVCAEIDPDFAKEQLMLLLREWYMHPNGQLPAYEFAFNDVNPPVHAWAAWRVYKITGPRGGRDRLFLERVFQKLLLNFTWWVNRKDPQGNNIFAGGFLGLDNVGVFDRSQPLSGGEHLEQADGTAWMAFFCGTMLSMALELASEDAAYEDVASKFFEHFVAITDAMNTLGGTGLWNEADGFYYDQLTISGQAMPVRLRSMVGLIPLIAVEILEGDLTERLPGFAKRMHWFLKNRQDLAQHISYMEAVEGESHDHRLLAIPSRERLARVLRYMLDENEFLSPFGIRSLSRVYREQPFLFRTGGSEYEVHYVPAESDSHLFGGNSNWRGPIWFPVNFLLIEALERYHHFYGDTFQVEFPIGSGQMVNLQEVAREIAARVLHLFLADGTGRCAWHGEDRRFADDPHWRDLVLFYEYFDGDTGRGCGASHQTGWTVLVARLLKDFVRKAD